LPLNNIPHYFMIFKILSGITQKGSPMNLIKLEVDTASKNATGNENTTGNVGIYELQAEEKVMRTYSNGLSFKHTPGSSRRAYKVAFSARIRELGLESARQCHLHAPQLMELFSRWKNLEEIYVNSRILEESKDIEELHAIAGTLSIPHEEMNVEDLYQALDNVFKYQNPKFLAARFAAFCKDRSNLGQSSFLRLVAAGRNYLQMIEKLWWLKSLFEEEPKEFLSFLLFGRAPWTETRISRRFKSSFTWARNFLVGVHNKFIHSLKSAHVPLPGIISPSENELDEILKSFIEEIEQKSEKMEKEEKDIQRITSFLNSLKRIKQDPSCFTGWILIPENKFSWRTLKQYTNMLHGISFSALRAVLIRACLHQDKWTHAIERCIRMFTPETTLKKPFHDRSKLHPLPIDLIMGQRFVIYRPGNAQKMKELLLTHGCLWFEVPNVTLKNIKIKAIACWHAPKKVLKALENGARLHLFRFNMPKGPGNSVKVDVILSGAEHLFISFDHLNEIHSKKLHAEFESTRILGIDVNRLSKHVLTGSRDLEMDHSIMHVLNKWDALERTISSLQARSDTCRDWKKVRKFKMELRLAHQRRSCLRNDLLRRARIQLGKKILEWNVNHVGIEADIQKDTKNKKGSLAKAITYMPHNISLIAQEIFILNHVLQENIKLVLVRKEGTSKYHHDCGGTIDRMSDKGTCRACGMIVNTHQNAADNIEKRSQLLIEKYMNNHSSGSTPSAC